MSIKNNKCLIGQVFGRLTVISKVLNSKGRAKFECTCSCGNSFIAVSRRLTNGETKSCGCARVDFCSSLGTRNETHGMSRSRTYSSWASMKTRCSNKNHIAYDSYGGRGIKVCERWSDFKNFVDDMGEKPVGLSLDRIDTNGNYEPGNCRWATAKEQARNKRNNHIYDGMCISEISEKEGIKYTTARERIKRLEKNSIKVIE